VRGTVESRGPAVDFTEAEVRADKRFTTYAYAHEFGSGVYDFNGRNLQVYGLPLGGPRVSRMIVDLDCGSGCP